MSEPHNVVESLRDVVQDILAPDMKATRMSVEAIHSEVSSIRAEMKLRDEKMTQLVHSGDDKLEILILSGDRELNQLINNGIERNAKDIQRLSEKLDLYIDICERLATLEARLPRQ